MALTLPAHPEESQCSQAAFNCTLSGYVMDGTDSSVLLAGVGVGAVLVLAVPCQLNTGSPFISQMQQPHPR